MNQLIRGAFSGSVATVLMTIVILGGRKLFGFHTAPPVEITRRISRRVGISQPRSDEGFQVFWMAGHLAYGAACGVLYVLVRRLLPPRPVTAGLIAGGTVWGVSYLGYLPALSLYPSPDEDADDRTLVMLAAHAVYGVALAETEHLLTDRFPERNQTSGW
ncbi:MAG: hypothetical protein M3457_06000 [Chloroflexota bacterium]|nr:hypothetical protein [Chloroflexota bacterium]